MADDLYVYQCEVFGDFHDPIAVRRKLLLLSDGSLNDWLTEAQSDDILTQARAYERLVPVVREAFGLPPVDRVTGHGVTEDRVIAVVNAFVEWLEGKG